MSRHIWKLSVLGIVCLVGSAFHQCWGVPCEYGCIAFKCMVETSSDIGDIPYEYESDDCHDKMETADNNPLPNVDAVLNTRRRAASAQNVCIKMPQKVPSCDPIGAWAAASCFDDCLPGGG
jgi:hypothetical protein